MGNLIDGILLIDKDENQTSFEVVRLIKSIFRAPKTHRVGHAGTLDPFATGLLIILLGQATKCAPYIVSERKSYQGLIRLGRQTDTLDPTGKLVKQSPIPEMDSEFVHEITKQFVGKIEQVPPRFSAIRYKGKRAYNLARRGLPVKLKKRTVTIYSMRIISIQMPYISIKVTCSAGTYIRRLAADLGNALGTVAMLISLRRESIGPFNVKNALRSNTLSNQQISRRYLYENMIPIEKALPGMDEIELNPILANKIKNGYQPKWKELHKNEMPLGERTPYLRLVKNNGLVAIAKRINNSNKQSDIKIKRVFF